MRAMILAAGYGTRLWPLTIDRAKPAIPFMNRPLVGYVAEYVARFGCQEVVINLHHQPESVRGALGDGGRFGVRLHYVEEPVILGTSGALDNARALLEGDTFLVINGKLATDIDLGAALGTHRRTGALATLVLQPNPARERFSMIETRDGFVTGIGPMPTKAPDNADGQDAPLMYTGIQFLEPRVFDYIPRGVYSDTVPSVWLPAIARGEKIAAHVAEGMWHELSTVPRYLDTSLILLRREGRDVETGDGSIIESGADVRESVLWEGVHVESGARVRRAVLGAGVRVPAGETYENVAVVRGELVNLDERPPKGLEGEFRGANFVAPLPQ